MVPRKCPVCNETEGWKKVDSSEYNSGISGKKAIVGGVLFGPVGAVLGGLSGKKKRKVTYYCTKCGFCHEFDD